MDNRSRNILYLFGIFLTVIIFIEILRPQPVNWNPSYTSEDKIPFGGFVLHQELQELMSVNEISTVKESPYTYLIEKSEPLESNSRVAYFFINNYLNFDAEETSALLDFVEKGNIAFIAATFMVGDLIDSLKIKTYTENVYSEREHKAIFQSPQFENQFGVFKRGVSKTYFTQIDTLNTTVLGHFENSDVEQSDEEKKEIDAGIDRLLGKDHEDQTNEKIIEESKNLEKIDQINFIKIPRGDGYFYVHTIPQAFSNYYLLNGNDSYAAKALSHFDANSILWDDYKKSGRRFIETPMRYILSEAPLKWAYYLTAIGILLFVLFKGKREQRIIPVIKPLENTTVEFTKTIGDLYFQNKNYSNIINKKIVYFLERVRTKFYIDTQKIDSAFAEKLATKNNKSKESVIELINLINHLKQKQYHTEADLIALNNKLEKFET
ncbi:MAG: DUF4350 domain-containing protein [Flavobacteriaceae bacterium]|nr:DUF4350 domain-containing protein [Flavobacteriaceae bacterium]